MRRCTPPCLISTVTVVAPASTAFSSGSFTTDEGERPPPRRRQSVPPHVYPVHEFVPCLPLLRFLCILSFGECRRCVLTISSQGKPLKALYAFFASGGSAQSWVIHSIGVNVLRPDSRSRSMISLSAGNNGELKALIRFRRTALSLPWHTDSLAFLQLGQNLFCAHNHLVGNACQLFHPSIPKLSSPAAHNTAQQEGNVVAALLDGNIGSF